MAFAMRSCSARLRGAVSAWRMAAAVIGTIP
jgi:hypothetical protein